MNHLMFFAYVVVFWTCVLLFCRWLRALEQRPVVRLYILVDKAWEVRPIGQLNTKHLLCLRYRAGVALVERAKTISAEAHELESALVKELEENGR